MGMQIAKAYVSVMADTSQASSDLEQAKPGMKRSILDMSTAVSAGVGFIAAQAIQKIVSEIRQGIQETMALASRQIDAETRVAAVVRATGQAAGFTAKQLREQASALQATTRTGDEAILEMQAKLLTFKKISGEVFERAQMAALDMAAVMGTDARGAIMQLAMALEDPERGLTRLRRAGVSFTEQQKAHIIQLTRQGKLQEAQKYLLKEIEGQLGGVAKAMADTPVGRLEQARNALGDMKEEIGKHLIPLQVKWTEMQVKTWAAVSTGVEHVSAALPILAETMRTVAQHSMKWWAEAFNQIRAWVSDALPESFRNAANSILTYFGVASGGLADTFTSAFGHIMGHLDIMLGSFEGFGAGALHIWEQTVVGFQSMWAHVKSWWQQATLEMADWFLDKFGRQISFVIDTIMDSLPQVAREKLLVLRGVQMAANDPKARQQVMRQETKKINAELESTLAEIGNKSLEASRNYTEATKGLPKFSEQVREAVEKARLEVEELVAPVLDSLTDPAVTAADGAEGDPLLGRGQTSFAGWGQTIQAALLQKQDPVEQAVDKQTNVLGGKLDIIAGGVNNLNVGLVQGD